MNDEQFDRVYQSGRLELNARVGRLVGRVARSVGSAFDAMHRIQFDSPWSKRSRGPGCA